MSDKSVLSIALLLFLHREISGLVLLQLEINYKGCGFSFLFFFAFGSACSYQRHMKVQHPLCKFNKSVLVCHFRPVADFFHPERLSFLFD